ncbi:FG-GAP-like repeat-containing protein [Streptomyces sp. NPDC046915]|uniref:FG-GAP-like repeat-containing protein n=1 Tax=Streptomyces sp. NPDC046915 TaxID=3155257 RepID=UPI0033CC1B9E
MRQRTPLLVAALTTGLLTALPAPAAQAAPAKVTYDFNGDGYRDLAIGAPCTDVGSASCAGAVVVMYGSSSGVSAAKKTLVTQNSAGIPGTAEAGDTFGGSLAVGDLDRDGYADLVVGAPGENGVGAATVVWGGRSGLSGGASLPQPSASSLGRYGGYSQGVAVGDFDGDGALDVTLSGQTATHFHRGPFTRTGTPKSHGSIDEGATSEIVTGDLTGDGVPERIYTYSTSSDKGGVVRYHHWNGTKDTTTLLPDADGTTGSIADVNGDGYGDLVLGDYEDPSTGNSPHGHEGGRITVWYGGPDGPDPAQTPTVVHQDTAGVPGGGETGDRFGATLSTGDVNGDGYADVAVGAPFEDLGAARDAGTVTVLYGSASGLTTKGVKTYSQDTAGVPGTAEKWDDFGSAVRLVDLNKDGRAELVAGADGENGTGGVWTLRGTAGGTTTTGAKSFTASDVSLSSAMNFGLVIAR